MIELAVVVAIIAVLISLLLPAVQSSREAARKAQCANNLLQLGLALGNYESSHQVLPPGVVNPTGPVVDSPAGYHFGWIAQILPFLEQKNVYRHLDFDVGVYAANNITARGVSLGVLLCPSSVNRRNPFGVSPGISPLMGITEPAPTSYAACHNDVEAPIDAGNTGVFFLNSHVRLDEVEDGLGNTLFLGEKMPGGDELGWASGTRATLRNTGTSLNRTRIDSVDMSAYVATSPVDPLTDPSPAEAAGLPRGPNPNFVGGFGSSHPQGANFALGDGSVRFIKATVNPRIFRLLAARADGEAIGHDQF